MLFCQQAQTKSLREICGVLSCCLGKLHLLGLKKTPNKSTLSYANAHRPREMYQELFCQTLDVCKLVGTGKHRLFAYWNENHSIYITRLKKNADYTVIEERTVPQNRNIIADQLIQFNGSSDRRRCPHIMRKVVVWDKEQDHEIVLQINHPEFGATTISAFYKDRWQIELFLKGFNQNLNVKTFVRISENALSTRIWTELIGMLSIKNLQFKSRFRWSLSNMVAFFRWNLFTYRDLWEWIDDPFDVLSVTP